MNTPEADIWVAAPPFRAWLRQLVSDTGQPWRVLAHAADVPSPTVRALLMGQDGRMVPRLRALDAERLYRLCPDAIERMRHEPAPCEQVRALAWALGLSGATQPQIADYIGISVGDLAALMGGSDLWCSRLQLLRARAACEARDVSGVDLGRRLAPLGRAA